MGVQEPYNMERGLGKRRHFKYGVFTDGSVSCYVGNPCDLLHRSSHPHHAEGAEEKAKEMKKLRRKRLTTSAYYNNLIKTSLGSIQSGDFLEDALLSGDEDIMIMKN